MKLSKKEKEAASEKIAILSVSRIKGEKSEDEIAEKLGFRSEWGQSPSERMYVWLKDRGLPEWWVYPKSGEGKGTKSAPEKPGRKARATSDVVELPPASAADDLFRKDLERLTTSIDELRNRWECLQAERFVLAEVYDEADFDIEIIARASFYRYPDEDSEGEFLEEEWKKICDDPPLSGSK